MANRVALLLPLMVVAFAVMAGAFLKGVNGDAASSFVRRRLVGHQALWAGTATEVPEDSCPLNCTGTPLPTCCQLPDMGKVPGVFYCANTTIDNLSCGTCGTFCPLNKLCCNGKCSNLQTDPKNCGSCGTKCPAGKLCNWSMCDYAE